MKARAVVSALLAAAAVLTARPASAQSPPNPLITVDEWGNGTLLFPNGAPIPTRGALAPDPGPGGAPAVLTYSLLGPPSLVAGDVLIYEPGSQVLSDLIRFNPAGTGGAAGYPASLLFYSALDGGPDGFDGLTFPQTLYSNTFTMVETGQEGDNGVLYTPTANQPGYVAGYAVSYMIRSDVVPEPASMALVATGLAAMFGAAARRRRREAER